jgi:hypothetical protein
MMQKHTIESVPNPAVQSLRTLFLERRNTVLQAEMKKERSPYDVHYGYIAPEIIERINESDVAMYEEIVNVKSDTVLPQVREDFDRYFLSLEEEKRMVGVMLMKELAARYPQVYATRRKHAA